MSWCVAANWIVRLRVFSFFFLSLVFVLIVFYVSLCRKWNGQLLARRRSRCVRRRDNRASFTAADVLH